MFNKTVAYFKDSYHELRLVTWPNRKQVASDTVMVLAVSFVFAVVLGAIDVGLTYLLQLYLNA